MKKKFMKKKSIKMSNTLILRCLKNSNNACKRISSVFKLFFNNSQKQRSGIHNYINSTLKLNANNS
jgi:hypothetical protein